MNQPISIEISAPDVQSAIDKGVAELGVSRDAVMVEVLEEPTRGLLGLGGRQARVRLTVIRAPAAPPVPPPMPVEPPAPPAPMEQPTSKPRSALAPSRPTHASQLPNDRPKEKPYTTSKPASRPYADLDELGDDDDYDSPPSPSTVANVDMSDDAKVGAEVLQTLLDHMGIISTVQVHPSETTAEEEPHWVLEIRGQNLGSLIGRRGDTLASLQYITRLITSRQIGRRANIVLDVEGYKSRRETMLKRLAVRMAEQVAQRGRSMALEPMPPHERRIVHMTLRNHPQVTTESVGEGDRRKVTIIPRPKSKH